MLELAYVSEGVGKLELAYVSNGVGRLELAYDKSTALNHTFMLNKTNMHVFAPGATQDSNGDFTLTTHGSNRTSRPTSLWVNVRLNK